MSDSTTKRCSQCREEKPATAEYFTRCKKSNDGLRWHCKSCQHKQHTEYYHRNHEKCLERSRKSNSERREYRARYLREHRNEIIAKRRVYAQLNRESIAEKKREYYQQNREYCIQKSAENRRNNREQRAAKQREYYRINRGVLLPKALIYQKQNAHIHRAAYHRRRARKLALPDTFTAQHWLICLDYWHNTCAVCGGQLRDLFGEVEPHADHWIPLSKSECPGTVPENMICLCSSCNSMKHNTLPEQWLIERFGKRKSAEILKRIHDYFEHIKQR